MDDSIVSSFSNGLVLDPDIIEFFQERAIEPNTWIRECIRYYKEFHRVPRPAAPAPPDPVAVTLTPEQLCALHREHQLFLQQRAQIIGTLQSVHFPGLQTICDKHPADGDVWRCDVCHLPFHSKRSVALHKRHCKAEPEPESAQRFLPIVTNDSG